MLNRKGLGLAGGPPLGGAHMATLQALQQSGQQGARLLPRLTSKKTCRHKISTNSIKNRQPIARNCDGICHGGGTIGMPSRGSLDPLGGACFLLYKTSHQLTPTHPI